MKKIFFVFLLFGIALQVNAQYVPSEDEKEEPKKTKPKKSSSNESFADRLYYGGTFGLQIGTNITYIDASPLVGYSINDDFSAGVGLSYIYVDFKNLGINRNIDFNTSIYGGRLFARHRIFDRVFAHTEIELLNMEYFSVIEQSFVREWVPGFYVGGGAYQNPDNRRGVNVLFLVNLLFDETRSIYSNPYAIRIGFNI